MKKSIKSLSIKTIKNINAIKGGGGNLGDSPKSMEYKIRVDDDI